MIHFPRCWAEVDRRCMLLSILYLFSSSAWFLSYWSHWIPLLCFSNFIYFFLPFRFNCQQLECFYYFVQPFHALISRYIPLVCPAFSFLFNFFSFFFVRAVFECHKNSLPRSIWIRGVINPHQLYCIPFLCLTLFFCFFMPRFFSLSFIRFERLYISIIFVFAFFIFLFFLFSYFSLFAVFRFLHRV